jgi:uncharacterized protein YbjQ (UPF0145 family)
MAGHVDDHEGGRIGGDGHRTWTSGLATAEFACLAAAGFTPVGQVMGASVHTLAPWALTARNPSWPDAGSSPRSDAAHTVLYEARREAMRTMTAECRALGGDGIIAVHVEIGPFHGEERTLAFQVRGTAVRANGAVRPPRPFSSDLSAQEFTALIQAGWVPVELVLGAALNRLGESLPDAPNARLIGRRSELPDLHRVVASTRRSARRALRDDAARTGADGVVVSAADLRVYEAQHQRYIEARFIGTAIAAFGAARPRPWSRLERLVPELRRPHPPRPSVRPEPVLRLSADAVDAMEATDEAG